MIIGNRARFQYSRYWLELVDPWPVGWRYDDEVYVDYVGDEYYLCDPVHPGLRIMVNVIHRAPIRAAHLLPDYISA